MRWWEGRILFQPDPCMDRGEEIPISVGLAMCPASIGMSSVRSNSWTTGPRGADSAAAGSAATSSSGAGTEGATSSASPLLFHWLLSKGSSLSAVLVTKRLWSLLVGVYRPTALSNRRLFSRFMQHRSSLRAFSASLLLPLCFGFHCESSRSFTLVFYVIWQIISCTTRWLRELHVAGLRTICADNACRGLQ